MGSNDWNLMAGLALEQMLERNNNGNLYPLTSLEIQVLTDIKEMILPDEKDESPQNPDQEQPQIPDTKQQTVEKNPGKKPGDKKRDFKKLDNSDLTG